MEQQTNFEFAKVFRQAAEKSRNTPGGANLVEDFIIPAINNAGFTIIKTSVLDEIKEVFKKYGITHDVAF